MRRLAELARAGSYELVQLDGRDAIRVSGADGTSTSFLKPAELAELRALLVSGPPAFEMPGIGTFTWDRGGFEHRADDVHLLLVDVTDPPADATALGRAFVRAREAAPQICAEAARQLAKLYNETWRNGPRLTAEQMAARMRLAGITIYAPGGTIEIISVSLDDGELFAGHQISVSIEPGDALVIGRASI